jgi:uncharacterized sporulation protein YeaH/YhbH (DUF444 family)
MHIIDRRLNPGGKSLSNRQRFIRRARSAIRNAVKEASKNRAIREIDASGEIAIPAGDITEPSFRREAHGGSRNYVLPGNKDYIEGDTIDRQGGGGSGSSAQTDGEGEDEFRFVLTREEFLDLFLEDLELPELIKRTLTGEGAVQWRRAGYRTYGSPTALSVPRTMRNSLARRIALHRPSRQVIAAQAEALEKLETEGDETAIAEARAKLEHLQRRAKLIPYIDPIDVRYRRMESYPAPVAKAVVFCLMDVSGSMDEARKDLAKRFYTLLYLFLTRRYDHVDVVFIRHTHHASEVDEETFFYSRETGGTVVSTALEEMIRIQEERYPTREWNIYAAQCSDGDNTLSDNPKVTALLREHILPLCQFYAYVEVASENGMSMGVTSSEATNLWRAFETVLSPDVPMAMRRVTHRREIYPVFRELFSPKESARA